MKLLGSRIVVFGIIILSVFACQQATEKSAAAVEEKIAKVEMKVDGMVCAMGCAKFIQDKVAEKEGVSESKVDFESGIAYFTYNSNAMSAEDLEKYIDGIHDGQYDATILSADSEAEIEIEEEEMEENQEEEEKKDVAQVVNKIQNISFPQLLTYFMKRL